MKYIDLHRHMEGSITPFVVRRIGQPLNPLWDGKINFFHLWTPIVQYMQSADRCEQIAYYSIEELGLKGVAYVEYSISPAEHFGDSLDLVRALRRGLARGRDAFGVESNLIYTLTRHFPEKLKDDLLCASRLYDEGAIAGLGLAGDEVNFPFHRIIEELRPYIRPDMPMSFHAGEFRNVDEIRHAVSFGVRRIGHAVCAATDPHIVAELRERRIGIEACITSELKLGNVDSVVDHPVFEFDRLGLLYNLNTDDPAVFGTEIDAEYRLVEPKIPAERITRNAIEMAFANERLKERLLRNL